MTKREINIYRDADELAQKAAEDFILLANNSVICNGRFAVALSGGSTPRSMYSLLALKKYRREIPWEETHLFWGDERCVPPDHPESNYRMAREALLSRIKIPPENIHRIACEDGPSIAANQYQNELKEFFQLARGQFPVFDLVILGLGEDGHTASLFPRSDAVEEKERLVVASYIRKLSAYRVSLTLPVLNHAAIVDFLVTGKSKAAITKKVLATNAGSSALPAARVAPIDGIVTWMITEHAAAGLIHSPTII